MSVRRQAVCRQTCFLVEDNCLEQLGLSLLVSLLLICLLGVVVFVSVYIHVCMHACVCICSVFVSLSRSVCLSLLTSVSVSLSDRLVGLVVRRPPRKRKVRGSNPACAGIFPGSSHTSDLQIGTPVATLPGAWRYRVSTGTGRPGVSIL